MSADLRGGGRGSLGMSANMADTIQREYRMVLGSAPRSVRRRDARKELMNRETHTLVLHVTDGGVDQLFHPDWWYDLRRGQLRIYGALLRFIDVSVLRRMPKSVLKMIPQWIDAYIDDAYEDQAA